MILCPLLSYRARRTSHASMHLGMPAHSCTAQGCCLCTPPGVPGESQATCRWLWRCSTLHACPQTTPAALLPCVPHSAAEPAALRTGDAGLLLWPRCPALSGGRLMHAHAPGSPDRRPRGHLCSEVLPESTSSCWVVQVAGAGRAPAGHRGRAAGWPPQSGPARAACRRKGIWVLLPRLGLSVWQLSEAMCGQHA